MVLLVQSDIASSIFCSFATRPALSDKFSSSAKSLRSNAYINLLNIDSVFAPIIISFLSAHRYVFEGTIPVIVVPAGSRISPAPEYSGTTASSILKTDSKIETSTTWPLSFSFSSCLMYAMQTPKAAWMPANVSPRLKLGRTGNSPGTPLRYLNPPNPSQTDANPGFLE